MSVTVSETTGIHQEMDAIRKQLKREQRSISRRKFLKNKLAVLGAFITISMILIAIFGPMFVGDPLHMDPVNRLKGPSADHWFGTDNFGRDILARVVCGTRTSMLVGGGVTFFIVIIGMVIGLLAGYYKALDGILMRICDGLKAIPSILLALALVAMMKPSTKNTIICLVIVGVPAMARIARSAALVIKEQTYIEAMKCLGAKNQRIIWKHIAVNILSPVLVQASFAFANAIITEAALSFLGAGVPAPNPSWGNILYDGKTYIYNSWCMIIAPGAFTALSVLGLNLLGDGIRDVLDPSNN